MYTKLASRLELAAGNYHYQDSWVAQLLRESATALREIAKVEEDYAALAQDYHTLAAKYFVLREAIEKARKDEQ
jgi:hypothetical protein